MPDPSTLPQHRLPSNKSPQLPFLWPLTLKISHLNPIPRRFRSPRTRPRSRPRQRPRRSRSRSRSRSANVMNTEKSIARLNYSFNVLESIQAFRRRRWCSTDIQYFICGLCLAFSLAITPSALFIKSALVLLAAIIYLMPITQQFFLPSLPIWTYLIYFFSSRYIPIEYRPHIWVKVLPVLEHIISGTSLSHILSAHPHAVLDILAWLPYGIGHFAAPAICSTFIFYYAAPGTLPVFARAFGFMCMLGVTIQLIFPCTPPWYETVHGSEPARYGMEGSPAGLARIDTIFGVDMYTTSFTTAPVPFGAFPSLHAANAVFEALFMQFCFPRFRILFILYAMWVCWATMYLNHHYAVDLIGGAIMAGVAYYISRRKWLPRQQHDKKNRWQYDYVEIGIRSKKSDEESGFARSNCEYRLGLLSSVDDSDEWTIDGSVSSTSLSYGESASCSSTGTPESLSPATPDKEFRYAWSPTRSTRSTRSSSS